MTSLSSEERLLLFKQSLEQAGVFPPNSPMEQIRGIVNVVSADLQAADYLPTESIPIPIHLFIATDDERDAEETQKMIDGWSHYGEVTIHEVPGTHTTMLYEPHVNLLAEQLAALFTTKQSKSQRMNI